MNWAAANQIGIEKGDEGVKVVGSIGGATAHRMDIYGTDKNIDLYSNSVPLKGGVTIADMPVFQHMYGSQPRVNLGLGAFTGRKLIFDYDRKLILASI